jgi:hypothetical protein
MTKPSDLARQHLRGERPTTQTPYRDTLPKALVKLLGTGDRAGSGYVDPLPDTIQEDIARAALTAGIQPKGAILAYAIARLRHGIGAMGDRPTLPAVPAGTGAWLEQRVEDTLDELRRDLRNTIVDEPTRRRLGFTREERERIVPNPNGYTDPAAAGDTNIVRLSDHRAGRP